MSAVVEKLLRLYKEQVLPKEVVIDLIETVKQTTAEQAKAPKSQKIAVIGVACRMPEADNHHEFWNNLLAKRNSVRAFPESRAKDIRPLMNDLERSRFVPGRDFWRAGYLDQIDGFDASFFSILPADAQVMDPQQRLFLEIAHEVFEDAGYTKQRLSGTKTGIYVGDVNFEYKDIIQETTASAVVGNVSPFICGRVARYYNLNGPTVNISTTCSSSLVAAHLATRGLLQGDCDLAVTGAINLRLFPFFLKNDPVDALNITSPEEVCRPFDNGANGVARGEGGGALLLKRYEDAVADGDYIYATIIASEVNNDGRSSSVGAPSPAAQVKLISAALDSAKINPESVAYIEAHGTGTKIGDPIEIQAITRAFAKVTDAKQFCGIGSIKTNIGHLTGGAAGFAGLLKVVLSLKHGKVPASLHFNKPNELIDFSESPVYFVDETLELKSSPSQPSRAGVSSFGFNGSNCHMLLEQHFVSDQRDPSLSEQKAYPFVFSANDPVALKQLLKRHLDAINAGRYDAYALADMAYTLAQARDHREYRQAGFASDLPGLGQLLIHWLSKDQSAAKLEDAQIQSFLDGEDVDLTNYFRNADGKLIVRRVPLVSYPFQRKRFWIDNPRLKWGDHQQRPEKSEQAWPFNGESVHRCWHEVLGLSELTAESDFFAIGGDSLIASQLLTTMRKRLNVDVPYKLLAENSSLGAFTQAVLALTPESGAQEQALARPAANEVLEDREFPLSHSQKRMWAQHYLVGETNVYNMPQALRFEGEYDHARFQRAVNRLVAANPPLRTIFIKKNQELLQRVIAQAAEIEIPYLDFEGKSEQELLSYIDSKVYQVFDLTKLPLFQCFVCRLAENMHVMVFSIEHIISDGWSLHLMFNGILQAYLGADLNTAENRDYEVFVEDERRWLASPQAQHSRAFWLEALSGDLPYTEIPGDKPRAEERCYIGRDIHYRIDAHTTKLADALAQRSGLTLYTLFLASVYVLAYKRAKQPDMLIGAPIAGRTDDNYKAILGSLINILPIRFKLDLSKDYLTTCRELHYYLLDCFENQRYPFDALVNELDIKADLSKNALFGINVAQQNFGTLERDIPAVDGMVVSHFNIPSITCKWDLHFEFIREPDGIATRLEYSTDYYSDDFASKLVQAQQELFLQLLENPEKALGDLLDEEEEFSLEWN